MASLGDMYLLHRARQALNQPTQVDRALARREREQGQMLAAQGMALKEQAFREQQKQNEFNRYKDTVALQAEYGALLGQEERLPTDPRLTQTYKSGRMKGMVGRQDKQQEALQEFIKAKQRQDKENRLANQFAIEQQRKRDVEQSRQDRFDQSQALTRRGQDLRLQGAEVTAQALKPSQQVQTAMQLLRITRQRIKDAQQPMSRTRGQLPQLIEEERRLIQSIGPDIAALIPDLSGTAGLLRGEPGQEPAQTETMRIEDFEKPSSG